MNLKDKLNKLVGNLTSKDLMDFQDVQILNAIRILARELNNEKTSIRLQDLIDIEIDKLVSIGSKK